MSSLPWNFNRERNKTLWLLLTILLHNLIYPLSTGPGISPILFYVVFSFMFVIATFMLTKHHKSRVIVTVSGCATFIGGLMNSYAPNVIPQTILYLSGIVYIFTMAVVLAHYIFAANRVLIEVILAAASLYLVIGFFYTPIFGLIELIEPGSFVASSGAAIDWQKLFYFSFVTLTTLGYGDITPVHYYAQAFAMFEAVTGVLYTVILLSRLVSLYEIERPSQNESKSD